MRQKSIYETRVYSPAAHDLTGLSMEEASAAQIATKDSITSRHPNNGSCDFNRYQIFRPSKWQL
ncbi:hypothetical protein [Yersinia aldovae]|uniref:Uncharacterized protein n=1 Tax=Yersinia aldovae TaxID=29483 RepID=A0ABP1YV06_YERAL|nr:hypothetical protein [Yersinia aldovae]CNL60791.1 Uncharacterised protein [Yersinia aldovae]